VLENPIVSYFYKRIGALPLIIIKQDA